MTTTAAAAAAPHGGPSDGPMHGGNFRTTMITVTPLLACLGSLVPVAGPLWGFRVICLLLATHAILVNSKSRPSELKTRLTALIGYWVVIMVGLLVLTPLGASGRTEIVSISTGLLLLWAVGTMPEPGRLMQLLPAGWMAAFLVTGVIGIRELITGKHLSNYYLDEIELQRFQASNYVASTFGNPNNYAFFLCSAFPFLMIGGWRASRPLTRAAYNAAAVLSVVLVFVTGSRLGASVIVAEFIVFFLASGRGRKLALIASAGLMVFLVRAVAPTFVDEVIPQATEQLQATFENGDALRDEFRSEGGASGGARLNLVLNGWDFAVDSALMGAGPGSFERQMSAGEGRRPTAGIVNPHSGWIEILTEYGIVVLVLFGLLLAKIAVIGWSTYRKVGLRPAEGHGDFGFVIALLAVALPVTSLMNSTFLQPSVVWLLLASIYLVATGLSEGRSSG